MCKNVRRPLSGISERARRQRHPIRLSVTTIFFVNLMEHRAGGGLIKNSPVTGFNLRIRM